MFHFRISPNVCSSASVIGFQIDLQVVVSEENQGGVGPLFDTPFQNMALTGTADVDRRHSDKFGVLGGVHAAFEREYPFIAFALEKQFLEMVAKLPS